jgi:hypothetical protein
MLELEILNLCYVIFTNTRIKNIIFSPIFIDVRVMNINIFCVILTNTRIDSIVFSLLCNDAKVRNIRSFSYNTYQCQNLKYYPRSNIL